MQFYYVIAKPKVDEKHIQQNTVNTKAFKLLNTDNLKVAIA